MVVLRIYLLQVHQSWGLGGNVVGWVWCCSTAMDSSSEGNPLPLSFNLFLGLYWFLFWRLVLGWPLIGWCVFSCVEGLIKVESLDGFVISMMVRFWWMLWFLWFWCLGFDYCFWVLKGIGEKLVLVATLLLILFYFFIIIFFFLWWWFSFIDWGLGFILPSMASNILWLFFLILLLVGAELLDFCFHFWSNFMSW